MRFSRSMVVGSVAFSRGFPARRGQRVAPRVGRVAAGVEQGHVAADELGERAGIFVGRCENGRVIGQVTGIERNRRGDDQLRAVIARAVDSGTQRSFVQLVGDDQHPAVRDVAQPELDVSSIEADPMSTGHAQQRRVADARAAEGDDRLVAHRVIRDTADDLDACPVVGRGGRDPARQSVESSPIVESRPADNDDHAATASNGTSTTSPRPASRSGASTWAASPTMTIDSSSGRMWRVAALRMSCPLTAATCGR